MRTSTPLSAYNWRFPLPFLIGIMLLFLQLMTPLRIDTLLDRYTTFLRVEKNVSGHTLRNYLSDLMQFFAFIENPHAQAEARPIVVSQIDHHRIHAYLSMLHRQNKKSSIGRKLSSIKSFFRFLLREGELERDPTVLIGTPKKEQPLPTHLPVDDMFRLLETPASDVPSGIRDRAILEVLYSCGL